MGKNLRTPRRIAYERQRLAQHRARRRSLLAAAKDKPCADCGKRYPPYVMDFDHRPGEVKSFNLGLSNSKALAAVQAEIAKCDVVCSNCHRERTWGSN